MKKKLKTLKTALRIERQVEKLLEMSILEIQARLDQQQTELERLRAELEQASQFSDVSEMVSPVFEARFQHQISTQNEMEQHADLIQQLLFERGQVEQLKIKQCQKIEGLENLVDQMEQKIKSDFNREQALELMDSYLRKSNL